MFTNPLYLFALAGLSIPIAIHLLSRKEGKIIKLGSVRHVVETSTQQFKGIKLNEIILLSLRCAMIIVFSLLLSGLQCSNEGKEKWAVVESGLSGLQNIHSVLDSLKKDGYELHLLGIGFPKLKDSSKSSVEINYWKLINDLKQKNLSQVIVFSKNNVNNFKGLRTTLPAHVRWISQPFGKVNFPLMAIRLGHDSVLLITGHSSSDQTFFTTERVSSKSSTASITDPDTIKVALVSDTEFSYDHKVFKAILEAIRKSFPVRIMLTETSTSKLSSQPVDWCIWLSKKPLIGINSKKVIRLQPQESTELILQTETNQWEITQGLNQEVVLRNNLTTQLATLFLSECNLQDRISANDRRMVSDTLVSGRSEGREIQASMQHQPADSYLIVLLLTLLMIERIIAYRRNQ